VPKSVYVVGGLGALGCLALSLMMQHLLKMKTDTARSPIAVELEEACAEFLTERIESSQLEIDGELTLRLQLTAKKGVDPKALARNASDVVWRRSHKWSEVPERLRIEVHSPEAAPVVHESRPAGLDSLRSGRERRAENPDALPPKPETSKPQRSNPQPPK
jgi:hypothetical protein